MSLEVSRSVKSRLSRLEELQEELVTRGPAPSFLDKYKKFDGLLNEVALIKHLQPLAELLGTLGRNPLLRCEGLVKSFSEQIESALKGKEKCSEIRAVCDLANTVCGRGLGDLKTELDKYRLTIVPAALECLRNFELRMSALISEAGLLQLSGETQGLNEKLKRIGQDVLEELEQYSASLNKTVIAAIPHWLGITLTPVFSRAVRLPEKRSILNANEVQPGLELLSNWLGSSDISESSDGKRVHVNADIATQRSDLKDALKVIGSIANLALKTSDSNGSRSENSIIKGVDFAIYSAKLSALFVPHSLKLHAEFAHIMFDQDAGVREAGAAAIEAIAILTRIDHPVYELRCNDSASRGQAEIIRKKALKMLRRAIENELDKLKLDLPSQPLTKALLSFNNHEIRDTACAIAAGRQELKSWKERVMLLASNGTQSFFTGAIQ